MSPLAQIPNLMSPDGNLESTRDVKTADPMKYSKEGRRKRIIKFSNGVLSNTMFPESIGATQTRLPSQDQTRTNTRNTNRTKALSLN